MINLKEFNFKNKKALVRCDFNVPLSKQEKILDDFRIKKSLATIKYLTRKGAKVILISHLTGQEKDKKYSLNLIIPRLQELLNLKIKFSKDCLGEKTKKEIEKMQFGDILLLENLRFYKEEEQGSLDFAKKLADLADVYVNEAFSVSHRPHASIKGIAQFLPSVAGLLMEKEIKVLSEVIENPRRPLVVIIGGAKISTKTRLIEQFLKKADHLLLGSKPAEILLTAKGILIGQLSVEEKTLKAIEKIELAHPKLHFPIDGQMALSKLGEGYFRIGALGTLRKEEDVFDIGPETRKIFIKIIKTAKTIIWNGPLGLFEKEPFDRGTRGIAEAIVRNHFAFKVAGGGDTVSAISKLNLTDEFDHISSGGGAMLQFLSGEKLPGLEALK
jgi:phosphoglycerate kinase